MIWSKERFTKTGALVLPVLQKSWFILLTISIVTWLMQWGVSSMHQARFAGPGDLSTGVVIGFGIFAFVLDSVLTVAWFLIIAQCTAILVNKSARPLWPTVFREYHQVFIEYVRAMISVLLWGLFFILPGVIRWIQLTFACYVSLLNGPYHQGQRDALATSQKIIGKHLLPLSLFIICSFALVETIEKFGVDADNFVFLSAFYLLAWLMSVMISIYLTLTYLSLDKEASV